jgi:urea transport system permease protein
MRASLTWIILLLAANTVGAADPVRELLSKAILGDDASEQIRIVTNLATSADPAIEPVLTAWRGGTVYLLEETNGAKVAFLLDSQLDSAGKARGINVADGSFLKDDTGKPTWFASTELTPVDTDAKLRKAIKSTIDLLSASNPNPKMRRDAVTKLGVQQNLDYLPFFRTRLEQEKEPIVIKSLREAVAITELALSDATRQEAGAKNLGDLRSITGLEFLKKIVSSAKTKPESYKPEVAAAAKKSVDAIQTYMAWGTLFGTGFRGFSLSAVLLVVALGLAITFGLMGVINMAHGELMMIGAYSAYVTQNWFVHWFGAGSIGFQFYFIAALVVAFFASGAVGLLLERCVIQFLYKRPLESLLATWGVSLILQQTFRGIFGAANVQVDSPSWLSGSFVVSDVLFAYNRLFVIGFAIGIVALTYFLFNKTSFGLQVRAVMQNRAMAACMGIKSSRINMMTFAFGSGLAGMAGACLSQIGNVGPSLGQSYIVDCFMIVVVGGVGNLIGTISASLGIGIIDQILQPFLGAVMGKITVLAAIILFLQWRPAGLFVTRSRSLES